MSNVLVASDLSDQSHYAIQRAIQVAQSLEAKLNILHVVDDRYLGNIANTITSLAEKQLKEFLQNELSEEQLKQCDVYIVTGEPDMEILRYAEKLKACVTVLGMHRKLTMELFSGTTADRVCHYNHGLTLLACNETISSYANVLCASDFSPASLHALQGASRLAPQAEFTVAHFEIPSGLLSGSLSGKEEAEFIQESQSRLQVAANAVLAEKAKSAKLVVRAVAPLAGIDQIVKESRIDLIALGKHSKSGIRLAVLGSVARSLLSRPPCDILVAGVS